MANAAVHSAWPPALSLLLLALRPTSFAAGAGLAAKADQIHGLKPPGDLTCSACLWTARAMRSALLEKMPKRLRKKAKRRELAKEVMIGGGAGNVCTRFPRNPVIDARLEKEMKGVVPRRYVDIDELKK